MIEFDEDAWQETGIIQADDSENIGTPSSTYSGHSHGRDFGSYERTPYSRPPRGGRHFSSYESQSWRDNHSESDVSESNYHSYRRSNRGRPGASNFTTGKDSQSVNYQNEENAPTTLSVNNRDVGKVIGRGGSTIKDLEEKSRARIKIDRGEGGDQEATIKIYGDKTAQDSAYNLITDLLNEDVGRARSHGQFTFGKRNSDSRHSLPVAPPSSSLATIDWTAAAKHYEDAQKQRWAKCPELRKDFYFEDPMISGMDPADVDIFRKENNNIMVSWMNPGRDDKEIPNPVMTFSQAFSHYHDVLRELAKQNFDKPTPIQSQAWPVLLKGLDLIGIAQTGTGKTFAFLLPALIHIDLQPIPRDQRGGPNVLILAPTRELALQIEKEANKLNYHDIKAVCVYGGGNRREQINIVTKGVQIVIATPGRLNDLVIAGVIDVASITYLVLDEADRMLDMGFEPQIKKILLDIRPDRQTVMTSATWPEGVRRLANRYMNNPAQVWVGTLDLATVHTVEQHIEIIKQDDKRDRIYEFVMDMGPEDKVIIFVGKKVMADDLSSDFALKDIPCQSIHGDRDQSDREQALEDLKLGDINILIATDVASRGIDIKDITHILNYDFPRNIEEYVHRVGRTGRAGRTGQAITFFTREDWRHARELIAILEESEQHIPQELYSMADRHDAWKAKREQEKEEFGGSRRGRGGGRRERTRPCW